MKQTRPRHHRDLFHTRLNQRPRHHRDLSATPQRSFFIPGCNDRDTTEIFFHTRLNDRHNTEIHTRLNDRHTTYIFFIPGCNDHNTTEIFFIPGCNDRNTTEILFIPGSTTATPQRSFSYQAQRPQHHRYLFSYQAATTATPQRSLLYQATPQRSLLYQATPQRSVSYQAQRPRHHRDLVHTRLNAFHSLSTGGVVRGCRKGGNRP